MPYFRPLIKISGIYDEHSGHNLIEQPSIRFNKERKRRGPREQKKQYQSEKIDRNYDRAHYLERNSYAFTIFFKFLLHPVRDPPAIA